MFVDLRSLRKFDAAQGKERQPYEISSLVGLAARCSSGHHSAGDVWPFSGARTAAQNNRTCARGAHAFLES